jgi:hypothetical protein
VREGGRGRGREGEGRERERDSELQYLINMRNKIYRKSGYRKSGTSRYTQVHVQ